jgi:hypothetical protein
MKGGMGIICLIRKIEINSLLHLFTKIHINLNKYIHVVMRDTFLLERTGIVNMILIFFDGFVVI